MHLQDRHGRVFDIGNHLCIPSKPTGKCHYHYGSSRRSNDDLYAEHERLPP